MIGQCHRYTEYERVPSQRSGGMASTRERRLAGWAATTVAMPLSGQALVAAFLAELLFTFALCYVVLNVATSKSHPDNSYFGLAIGFTVLAGAVAVGAISGGAFNPSVTVGAALMGMFAWPTLWVYIIAQVIGGAAAGVTFLALNPDDK